MNKKPQSKNRNGKKPAKAKKHREPQWVQNPAQERVLNYRVYRMTPGETLLYTALAFILGGAAGLVFYGGLFSRDGKPTALTLIANVVVFVVAGAVASRVFLPLREEQLRNRRQLALRSQFRSLMESLATSMTVDTVEQSFRTAYQDMIIQYGDEAYITKEMREIVAAGNNEIGLEIMLEDFAKRSGCEDIQDFSNVFSASRRRGGKIAQIVRQTHDIIGEKMEIEDEITSKMSSNQVELNVITVAPLAIVLMLRVTNQSFSENFATPLGVVVMTIALCLFYMAYRIGQKIVTSAKKGE